MLTYRTFLLLRLYLLLVSLFFSVVILAGSQNGFDLSSSSIDESEIFQGGPPRDGIPSIDKPNFIAAIKADLSATDRVLGIEVNGEFRAYPIRILNWHEIVNDEFNDEKIVVTFCPLCGTGMVYSATIDDQPRTFGVSGLLYNSDVLLYDRETQSLWSQILSTAISGPSKGKKLTPLSVSHTSWKDWKDTHPQTDVLSTNTGFQRDYQRSPYGDYNESRTLYFPVSANSKRYHPKERVLGITVNGKHKAYPFTELAQAGGSQVSDTF